MGQQHNSSSLLNRIFYGLSILVISALSVQFISNVYDKWNRNPVIVAINPSRTLINTIPFPAITICNMNQVSAKKAKLFSKWVIFFIQEIDGNRVYCNHSNRNSTENKIVFNHHKVLLGNLPPSMLNSTQYPDK